MPMDTVFEEEVLNLDGLGEDTLVADLGRYEFNLAGLDEEMLSSDDDLCLLPSEMVTPWPPPAQDRLDLFEPTVSLVENGMGSLESYAFQGVPALSKPLADMQKVVHASLNPGTKEAGLIAQGLAKNSERLVKMAYKRFQARDTAQREIKKLMPQIEKLEYQTKVAREVGDIRNVTRKVAVARTLGKRVIRFAKVEAIAQGMALNATAQANMAQQIAVSVLTGQPNVAATLGAFYNKLGSNSARMKTIRKEQIVKSTKAQEGELLSALLRRKAHLLRGDAILRVKLSRCSIPERGELKKERQKILRELAGINIDINKICARNPKAGLGSGFDGLEDLAMSSAQLRAKWAKDAAARAKQPLITRKFTNALSQGWLKAVPGSSRLAYATPGGRIYGTIDRAITRAGLGLPPYGPPALQGGAPGIAQLEKRIRRKITAEERRAITFPPDKPSGQAKSDFKQMTKDYKKNYVDRQERKVFGKVGYAIGKGVESGVKAVGKVAGALINFPCQALSSTVGKIATQVVAGAAGTAFGGPAGGMAGAVIANRMNDVNKSICKGLKDITSGKNVLKSLARTGKSIGKGAINPKNLLRDATSAGMAYLGGGGATGLLNKFGGAQIGKLGINQAVGKFGSKALSAVGGKGIGQFVQQAGGRAGQMLLQEGQKRLIRVGQKYATDQAGKLLRPVLGARGARIVQRGIPNLMRGKLPAVPTTRDVRRFVQRELPRSVARSIPMNPRQRRVLSQVQRTLQRGRPPIPRPPVRRPPTPAQWAQFRQALAQRQRRGLPPVTPAQWGQMKRLAARRG